MVYIIEKSFDVDIHNIIIMRQLYVLINQRNSVFLASVWAEPITVVMELCFADWFKNL